MNYETAAEIEHAVARYFDPVIYVIVPNLSHGMVPYEMDLCMLDTRSFYASEVEIKISKADLKRDAQKWHKHDHNYNLIRYLWFAMPLKAERLPLLRMDILADFWAVIIQKKPKRE